MHNEIHVTIMNELEEAIERSGISITYIAQSLGKSRRTVYNWMEQGLSLSRDKLEKIGDVINHDFSSHFSDWKKSESRESLDILDKAELIHLVRNNSREIKQLEERIKALEIEMIKLKIK